MNISGAITLTAPTAATTNLTVGAGVLNAASITIPGSATASRFATVSVSTGTITITGSITFSGTAAQARFISTGASTVNVGGNFGSGGNLNTSATGTINFNGSVAQSIGAYTTYYNIAINNTSGGVSFLGTTTIGGTLTVTTGTLTFGAVTTTVSGATSITGVVTISSTTGTKIFTGLVTINPGGVWNNTANEAVSFRGGITHNGTTFTAGTGVHTFDTNSRAIGGTTAISIPSVTVTGVTLTNNTTLTVNTALSGSGGLTQGSGATLNIGGTSAITTLTASVNPNTVNYTSTAANQTVVGTTYHHLAINKSARTATLGGNIIINGDLTITTGTLNTGSNACIVNGTTNITGTLGITNATWTKSFVGLVTVNAGGTWNNSANSAVTFQGGITHNGTTFTAGTGVYTFDTNNQALGGTTAISIPSVTVTGVTLTNNTTLTVNTALGGTGGLTQGSGATLNIGGTSTIVSLDASVDSNTINYTSATAVQTVVGTTYHHLTINKSGQTATLSADTIVNGDFTITAGTLDTSGDNFALTLNGSFTNGGIFTANSSSITIGGTSPAPSIDGFVTTGAFLINRTASTATLTGDITAASLTMNGSGGTLDLGAALLHTINGDVTITAGTLNGDSSTLGLTGNWDNDDTFTAGSGAIIFHGSSAQAIGGTGATAFNNVTISNASAAVSANTNFSAVGTLTVDVNAVLTPAAAVVVSGTGTLSGNGSVQVTRTAAVDDFSLQYTIDNKTLTNLTVDYAGTAAQEISALGYGNLKISNTTAAVTASADFDVGGTLAVNASALLSPAAAVVVNNAAAQGTITGLGTVQVTRMSATADYSSQYKFTTNTLNNLTVDYAGTAAQEISALSYGSLKISNTAAAVTASADFDVSGTLTVNASALLSPAATVVVNNAATQGAITGLGTVQVTRTSATADYSNQYKFTTNTLTDLTVDYAGTSAQIVSALTYGNIKISNSNGVTLAGTATVTGTLTLAGGNITTDSVAMVIDSSGSVSRTSGHIAGNLQKVFAAGAQSFTFDIGDATDYTPVSINSLNVTTPGNVTAAATATEHPGVGTSGIDSARSVNRFWTLTDGGGLGFSTYDATFNFAASVTDGGAAPGSFVVRQFNGAAWLPTTAGTKTATSTGATGISSLGDFAIGEQEIDHYVVNTTSPQTAGITFLTTVTAEDLLNETVVYDNSTVVTMGSSGSVQFDSNGDASFGDNTKALTTGTFTISTKDNIAETISITVTDGNSKTGSNAGLLINPGAVASVAFVQQPADAVAGAAISPAITVQLKDALGNNVSTGGVSVAMALTTGTGVFSGTTPQTTDGSGLATFNDLSINLTGSKNLTASSAGLTLAVSDAFTISAGAAVSIIFVQQPTDTVANDVISPAITVQLKDILGNNVSRGGVSVAMALTTGTGVLSGTTPQSTDGSGLATFSDLSINLEGAKNLTASSAGLTSAESDAFTITLGTGTKVRVETVADGSGTVVPLQSITSGRSITVYAIERDDYDNFVANVAADVWSLENATGGVVAGDLVPGGDRKSAVFTGHFSGTTEIKVTTGSLSPTNSGVLTVTPGVDSTSPSHEATGVTINTAIRASFSEAMDTSTVTTETFTINDGSGNIGGSVSYRGTTATFTPSANLTPSTVYTATITTGVEDLAGNAMAVDYTWEFTTGTDTDTSPPTVSATSPVHGASGVAVNRAITATFSEAMDAVTVTAATFTVNDGSGNISGSVSCRGMTVTFSPTSNLTPSIVYTATITTGVKDLAGNAMTDDYTWSFTTGTDTDITPPAVSDTSPVDDASGVAINGAIAAVFSETIDVSTISTATFTVNDGSSTIGGSVMYHGTVATFTPLSDLIPSATYTATITTGVRDLAGNAMAADYTWDFTAGTDTDITSPAVSSTSPVNGASGAAINGAITVTFFEAMDVSTVSIATFSVYDGSSNVSGSVSYSGTTATFAPSGNLAHSTAYTVTMTRGVKDLAGNAMAADYTWNFTTGTDIAVCRDKVMTVSPEKIRLKLGKSAKVTVTVTGEGGCPVEGKKVRAQVKRGRRCITVHPRRSITDAHGQTEFTITELTQSSDRKMRKGRVKFKAGSAKAKLKVKVK